MATSSSGAGASLSEKLLALKWCSGCLKGRPDLGDVTFKLCGGCQSVSYCSKKCQAAHWGKEHKKVCKKRGKDRSNFEEGGPSPKFVADLDKWSLIAQQCLNLVAVMLMQERAILLSSSGSCVKPEDVARDFCLVVNADYTPGNDVPFRVRDDYGLRSLNTFCEPRRGEASRLQKVIKVFKEATESAEMAAADEFAINTLLNVGEVSSALRSNMTREQVNSQLLDNTDVSAREYVSILNSGAYEHAMKIDK